MDDLKEYAVTAAALDGNAADPPKGRPFYVWVVVLLALLFVAGDIGATIRAWAYFGKLSPSDFLVTLIVPGTLAAGAIALFFMRKVAVWLFLPKLLLVGYTTLTTSTLGLPPLVAAVLYIHLALISIIVVCAISLRVRGRLR